MTTAVNLRATRREWIGLSILILPTLIVSMDMTVTYLALPVLSAALHPTSAELLWITDIFGFFEAGMLIVMGSLGDRIGLKKLLLCGASAFTVASVLAAFAPSAFWLIVARAVMGIAGATLLPTVLSLIRNMFHDNVQRTFAMGLYTTCFSSGTMLGPIIGGFLLSHFWWGSIFLMPVPLILIMLFTAPALLPEFKDHHAKSLDLLSSAFLICATLLAILGIKQIAQNGWDILPLVCIAGGSVIGVLFVRRQKLLTHPLIDLSLFKQVGFPVALTALFIGLFSWAGIFLFVGQYLQSVLGISSFSAGLWMLPGAAGSIILCMFAPVAIKYISRGKMIATGLAVLTIGILLLTWLTINSLALLAVAMFLISGGCGLTVTLGIDMVVASAPPNKAGAAAGISETSTNFGAALGVALLGCLWTAIYRDAISKKMPSGLSPHDTDAVKNTIGGAVAQATRLHQPALANLARQAFVHSLHLTALVSAFLVFIVAVLVAVKFNKGSLSAGA
ncbi:MAG TPA: MFS transporter [Mucilaginibacter sp.]|jgi:DHA2 family multidrug resistance protein-like MFS transporter|nr:MFS transporter [Mucilaginibacter sp.]